MKELAKFVKQRRKEVGLTHEAFADRAGFALTTIREIKQNKINLNFDKVSQVLKMFGINWRLLVSKIYINSALLLSLNY